MTHSTCRLTAKNRDQLRNPTLGNRVWASYTFTFTRLAAAAAASFTTLVLQLAGHITRLAVDFCYVFIFR